MELWNDRLDKFYITGRQFRIEKRETALYHGAAKKQLETVNGKSSSSRKFVTCDCSAAIPKIVTLLIDFRWRRSIHLTWPWPNGWKTSGQRVTRKLSSRSPATASEMKPYREPPPRWPPVVHRRVLCTADTS